MSKRVLLLLPYILLIVSQTPAKEPPDLEDLDHHMFIGQVYPSGNVYVRKFMDISDPTAEWPHEIHLTPVAVGADLPSTSPAQFIRPMESEIENNAVKSVFIPGAESMNEGHNGCGAGEVKKENPSFKELSGDFFYAILDHCEPNDGIAIFQIRPSRYSYLVIGTDGTVSLSNPKVIERTKRPLTSQEQQRVEKEKEAGKGSDVECTTVPAYLDSAVQIFQATIDEQATLRLSNYENPGCGGHLASIYVLDVLKNGVIFKSFSISQYQGAL